MSDATQPSLAALARDKALLALNPWLVPGYRQGHGYSAEDGDQRAPKREGPRPGLWTLEHAQALMAEHGSSSQVAAATRWDTTTVRAALKRLGIHEPRSVGKRPRASDEQILAAMREHGYRTTLIAKACGFSNGATFQRRCAAIAKANGIPLREQADG